MESEQTQASLAPLKEGSSFFPQRDSFIKSELSCKKPESLTSRGPQGGTFNGVSVTERRQINVSASEYSS